MADVTRIFDILLNYSELRDGKYPVFISKIDGVWESTSKESYRRYVLSLASALLHSGLQRGDRVATVMRNRAEWNIVDMALLTTGIIHVPLYSTLSTPDYVFILREAGVRAIISDDESTLHKIEPFRADLPRLKHRISLSKGTQYQSYSDLIESGQEGDTKHLLDASAAISPGDTATIIYTSGTTGTPKGVMLSHRNIVSNFLAVIPISGLRSTDTALSALPLCHVYERMLNYAYQHIGMKIYYAESLLTMAENLREVKPDIFCAVPRVIEKFYERILHTGRSRGGSTRYLYLAAVRFALHYDPTKPESMFDRLSHRLYDRFIYSRWREALGGRLRIIVSGGASLQPRLARLFWAAGIKVTEGYGLTETSPVITVNHPDLRNLKIGTVGTPLPEVEIKIAADGEILCRGPNIMQGYYLNPELTQETIDADGWFHTGDIGCIEDGRFLKITDRKKEIFKTSGGRYIAPQVIENRFKESSFIEHIIVVGENRRFPGALIIPDFEYLRCWCDVKGHTYPGDDEALSDPVIYERIEKEIQHLNENFSQTEKIKRFLLLNDTWSQENGMLSPTLKLRRNHIKQRYLRQILSIYEDESGFD